MTKCGFWNVRGLSFFVKQLPEMRELGPIKELSKSFKVTRVVSDRSGIWTHLYGYRGNSPSILPFHGCHAQLHRLLTVQGHPAEGVIRGWNAATILFTKVCPTAQWCLSLSAGSSAEVNWLKVIPVIPFSTSGLLALFLCSSSQHEGKSNSSPFKSGLVLWLSESDRKSVV